MFSTSCPSEDKKDHTHFQMAISCISESLKIRIISSSYDEIAICFYNTREKKNLQDISGVFVFTVAGEDGLGRPTARLIKEFDQIEESFMKNIEANMALCLDHERTPSTMPLGCSSASTQRIYKDS
uniref:Ku70/Ku80 N-terminal alpha/beta domain-containing protein n=1 Tax=Chenopodium quinoa TaxID=63459 RepID=A0A803NCB5_CHEQI